jgi:hypothetical protein
MSEPNELKPCPFCQFEACMHVGALYFWAKCKQCNAEGSAQNTAATAAKAWNHRPVQDELVEALKASLPLMAHRPECIVVNPAFEWGRMGSVSVGECKCAIAQVEAALRKAESR